MKRSLIITIVRKVKLATANLAIVYSIALDQVQRYHFLVEACIYLSDFAYYMLIYLTLEILANDKPRMEKCLFVGKFAPYLERSSNVIAFLYKKIR